MEIDLLQFILKFSIFGGMAVIIGTSMVAVLLSITYKRKKKPVSRIWGTSAIIIGITFVLMLIGIVVSVKGLYDYLEKI